MAIFHLNAKVISRAQGRSATAACAYRAGQKIRDERTGLTFDYTRKREVTYRKIMAPGYAPAWLQDRAALWNAVEKSEVRKDAQVAREIEVALPIELSAHQQIILLERYVTKQFVKRGMVADVCIHNKPGNPHAHILLTTREITPAGFGKKSRDWNTKEQLEEWRTAWAEHVNRRLFVTGHKSRVDHRTLQAQGIDREPEAHLGPQRKAMQAKGRLATAIQPNHQTNTEEEIMMNKNILQSFKRPQKKFVSMPSTTDGKVKRDMDHMIFTRDYLEQLPDELDEYIRAISKEETDIGACVDFKINPSGDVLDYGSQMSCLHGNSDEVKVMVMLAKAKGWEGIHLTGSDEFKEKVFLNAVLSGAYKPEQITGYTPSRSALEILEMAGINKPKKDEAANEPKFDEQPVNNNKNKLK